MKRRPMKKSSSKKLFSKTAQATNPKNLRGTPMRGGGRL